MTSRETIRILLVDDDEAIRLLVSEMLAADTSVSFSLDWQYDYDTALQLLVAEEHDIALVDYRLQNRSGMELLRQAVDSGCRIPIILLTGYGDRDIDIEAMRSGAADYIVKSEMSGPLLERSIRYSLEHARALEALRESAERYALAMDGAEHGVWDWDLRTNNVHYSSCWISMLGYGEKDIGNSPSDWFSRVHPDDVEPLQRDIRMHCEGQRQQLENEYRILAANGEYRWMLNRGLAVRDRSGKAFRLAGSQTDITERKLAEQQLMHDALHDPLTGLANRTLFSDRLKHAIAKANRTKDFLFAVLFLDLDRFKDVNDSFGHLTGDRFLTAVARRLEACVRPGDTVSRFGGDEFVLLLEDVKGQDAAVRVARRILEQLSLPFVVFEREIKSSVSVGIALNQPAGQTAEELLRNADIAMYSAKTSGRAKLQVYSSSMQSDGVLRFDAPPTIG